MSFKDVDLIYHVLEDDVSKQIFLARLNYSLSGNIHYIDKMVNNEMARYGIDDVMMRLDNWLSQKQADKKIALFGIGFAGIQIYKKMTELGHSITCIVDNDPAKLGKKIGNTTVCNPNVLVKEEMAVIIGVNSAVTEINNQLLEMQFLQEDIFVPDKEYWLGNSRQYFDHDIVQPSEHETFIDGGSLDGKDSLAFQEWSNAQYDLIHVFEPDSVNFNKIKRDFIDDKKVITHEIALWNSKEIIQFDDGENENSHISTSGGVQVQANSIDNIISNENVTFIKMDIEGAELQAIEGAKNTIRRYRPKLAICVYHKPEDIIDIPARILELNKDYRLYLRHYSYVDTETVLYAI